MNVKTERKYWLDEDRNVHKLLLSLTAVCVVLLLWDLLPEKVYHRHPHFDQESWFGFYVWLGALSCVVLAIVSKVLRTLAHRAEDYYDD